jgi:hypothetical protein
VKSADCFSARHLGGAGAVADRRPRRLEHVDDQFGGDLFDLDVGGSQHVALLYRQSHIRLIAVD